MSKKFLSIVVFLLSLCSIIATQGCIILTPETSAPVETTTPSESTNSTAELANPGWSFPADSNAPGASLPDFYAAFNKVMPSVVVITTETIVYGEKTPLAAGSGVIIDAEEGYVVTNNHVIENAQSIQVELYDGKTFSAQVVGTDALTDLAVLKINAPDLPHAIWGDSSLLLLSEWVLAIGNAGGGGISVTQGIVSRLDVAINVAGSTLRGLIQTTAPINPGNSGGPLINMAGEVIGVTTVKVAEVGYEGMGYAISSSSAKPIIENLIHQGYITRPWLGVETTTVNSLVAAWYNLPTSEGVLIASVVPGGPADRAGLMENDIIIRIEDTEIKSTNDLLDMLLDCQIGQQIDITFIRGKDTQTNLVALQESPPPWN
jgi:serine protease Do